MAQPLPPGFLPFRLVHLYKKVAYRPPPVRLPERFAHRFNTSRTHDVKTDAYAQLVARVGINGMLQPGREAQIHPLFHSHHHLVRVFAGQRRYRRTDNARLDPWVVAFARICPFGRFYIINAYGSEIETPKL